MADAVTRGITRLCHFTPSRNLLHVLASGYLKDRKTLDTDAVSEVNPTDEYRLDGHREKICCSVEYPNSFYLDIVRKKDLLFHDWVVLFINPVVLWSPGTLFCRRNAAAENGGLIGAGWPGYASMFAQNITGAGGKQFARRGTHLHSAPTDMQAEVLVRGPIPLDALLGMAMSSENQVRTERARWDTLGLAAPNVPIVVAPDLFDKNALRNHIWNGRRPSEIAA
ncbi:DarT ssDNA thymidine ADP-ribosyltransferase family protein [Paraburkholderia sediminicola]|uniref:DarT ssDNA thymidine ADP-ribosyltransferase family protein n=1 Tax=Paraburkholderia sediminicola TaxID=458836 RepID=UPI0038B710B0